MRWKPKTVIPIDENISLKIKKINQNYIIETRKKYKLFQEPPDYPPPDIPHTKKNTCKINSEYSQNEFKILNIPIFHKFILIPKLFMEYLRNKYNLVNIQIIKLKLFNDINNNEYNLLIQLIKPYYIKNHISIPQNLEKQNIINMPFYVKNKLGLELSEYSQVLLEYLPSDIKDKILNQFPNLKENLYPTNINDLLINLEYVRSNEWCKLVLQEFDNYIIEKQERLTKLSEYGNIFIKENNIKDVDILLKYYSAKYYSKNYDIKLDTKIPLPKFIKTYNILDIYSQEYLDEILKLNTYYNYIENEIKIYEEFLFAVLINKYFPKCSWIDYHIKILQIICELK